MAIKRRSLLWSSDQGNYKSYSAAGIVLTDTTYRFVSTTFQETSSLGKPFFRRNQTRFKGGDCGSPFDSRTAVCSPEPKFVKASSFTIPGVAYREYQGPIFAYKGNNSFKLSDCVAPSSPSTLDALGSIAIAKVIPTNALAGLGTFLGELRELPTSSKIAEWAPAVRNAMKHPGRKYIKVPYSQLSKAAAKDYLNFQFGWVPFVKDVKEFLSVAKNVDKHLAQYVRDSGRNVRRKYSFPDEVTTEVEELDTGGYGDPVLVTQLYVSKGKLTRTTEITRKRWFSGCFTYYLPKQQLQFNMRIYAKMYGLDFTPDLVWNLAPWTWALDWVGNFGSVVHNVSAFARDGLVMRYGYVMELTRKRVTYTLTDLHLAGEGKVNLSQTYVYTTKVRRKATPFGFGLNPSTFSARQWSIIAALGISKAPRSLNW